MPIRRLTERRLPRAAPLAVAIAKPFGKVDQDVGGVLVAPEPWKLISHRVADETGPDKALEALAIELA